MTDELSKSPLVRVKLLRPDSIMPIYQTAGAAGFDLVAAEDAEITADPYLMRTGVALDIPHGYEGQIRGRSGNAFHGLMAHVGTVDCDYRGEIGVLLYAVGRLPKVVVKKGARIAQMIIAPVARAELRMVGSLEDTDRGSGGFGSTGV